MDKLTVKDYMVIARSKKDLHSPLCEWKYPASAHWIIKPFIHQRSDPRQKESMCKQMLMFK